MAKNNYLFNFDSALTISAVTAYSYLLAYSYILGYCAVFNISSQYVSLDITTFWQFWTDTVIALASLMFFIYIITTANFSNLAKYPKLQRLTKSLIESIALMAVIFFALHKMFLNTKWLFLIFLFGLFVALYLIELQLTGEIKEEQSARSLKELRLWIDKVKPQFFTAVFFLLVSIFIIVSGAGFFQAQFEDEFLRLQSNREYVIIEKFGDDLICKKYDFVNKRFLDIIAVIKIDGSKPYVFEKVHIVPIRMQQ